MKRNIKNLLFSVALVMCCVFSASAQLGTPPNDEIWYTTSDGNVCTPYDPDAFGATIISNDYANGHGTIKFNGNVTRIGYQAFSFRDSLTSVTIPNSVVSIGNAAFENCYSLTFVTIPSGVTSIEIAAFMNCYNLVSVSIPYGVTRIEQSVFQNCSSLTSVTIPSSVTSIGVYAFANDSELTDIFFLGNGDITIGYQTFFNTQATIYVANTTNFSSYWEGRFVRSWRSGRGDGTEGSPYEIENYQNLYGFSLEVQLGNTNICGKLTADITMNTNVLNEDGMPNGVFKQWLPIGSWGSVAYTYNGYSGEFNGNGHTISGLYCNDGNRSAVGLFGMTNNTGDITAYIHDLGVKDSYFRGKSHVGGICGDFANGWIENCWNAATVQSAEGTAGGIVGSCWKYSTMSGCYNTGKVAEGTACGGICGSVAKNTSVTYSVSNCVSLEGKCSVAYNLYDDANISNVHIKNAEAFANGEVCWILNGQQRSAVWRQQLGTNSYPVWTGNYLVYYDAGDERYRNETVCEHTEDHLHTFEQGTMTQPSGATINCWHCTACGKNYLFHDRTKELPETEPIQPSAGDGSQDNPYQIATLENLLWFANHVNSGNASACAILMADITMNTNVLSSYGYSNSQDFVEWTPIGGRNGKDFGGDFDGNGHTVSGLFFNNTEVNNVGLFGKAVNNAHIHDLGIKDSYFNGKDHVGGICGDFASGLIENCWNGATADARDWNAGGISGSCWIYASIRDCYNIGRIFDNDNPSFGGICGAVYANASVDYTISNCYTLSRKCSKVYGSLEESCPASKINHSFVKDDDAFASGEVCYKLNHGVTDGSQKWYQTLNGTDDFPVLDNSHGTVFYGYDGDVLKYSNTPITVGATHRNICAATCDAVGYTMECWEDTRSRRFYAEEACATELNAAYVVTYSPVMTVPEYDCNLAAWRWRMKDENVTYDGVTFINALEKVYSEHSSYIYNEYVWFKVKDATARNVRLKWHLDKNAFNGELYYKINDGDETKIDVSGNIWVQNLPDLQQDDRVTVYYRITGMCSFPLTWTMSLEYYPGHFPEHITGIVPTETTEGRYGYYRCTKCGMEFKDELCSEELTDMTDLIVPEAQKNEIWYISTDNGVISPDYTSDFGATITGNQYNRGLGVITFDNEVTNIGIFAFAYRSSLQEINIPSTVTSIEDCAFGGCSSLQEINIPSAVTSIGNYAFGDCSSLQEINIPSDSKLGSIGEKTFTDCGSLQSIIIPSGVTSIGMWAFHACSSLSTVTFNSLPVVGTEAFWPCDNLNNRILNLTDSEKPYIGNSLNAYHPFTEAHYHGTLEPGEWGTITLPFVPSIHDGIVFFAIDNVDAENGILTLSVAENIEAGKPYLFRNQTGDASFTLTATPAAPATDVPVTITVSDQTVEGSNFTLKGNFQTKELTENGLYEQQGGEFVHTNSLSINPFHAYLKDTGSSAPTRIVIDGGTLVKITNQDDSTITLSGLKKVEFIKENNVPAVRVTRADDSTVIYTNPKKVDFGK